MYDRKKDAVVAWVNGFNEFPQDMIQILMNYYPDSWQEVTYPAVGDRVYVFEYSEEGEIIDYLADDFSGKDSYVIELDNGEIIGNETEHFYASDFEVLYDDGLPMWGYLWQFSELSDKLKLEDDYYIRKMSECGFRIYENEEWGFFFGIDGAGYDFYAEHWLPLYDIWGLHWSKEDLKEEN